MSAWTPERLDDLATRLQESPHIAHLSAGAMGTIATYLPGRRISGLRVGDDDRVEVHVVMTWGSTVDDVEAFEAQALTAAGVAMELVPPRYRSPYFAHVWGGGYSAGYYAYLWAEALAADAFAGVVERGGMNRQNGQRFRDTILSRGFATEPMQMFAAFRGRNLDTKALMVRRGLVSHRS